MSQNPGEGRLTAQQQAERLREARKQTTVMKRQYRDARRTAEAKAKAERWNDRHEKSQQEAMGDMRKAHRLVKPLNRRVRRNFAKRMNVFKTPTGWKNFNIGYAAQNGVNKPFVKKDQVAPVKVKSNIEQAMEAAREELKGE